MLQSTSPPANNDGKLIWLVPMIVLSCLLSNIIVLDCKKSDGVIGSCQFGSDNWFDLCNVNILLTLSDSLLLVLLLSITEGVYKGYITSKTTRPKEEKC